MLKVDDYRITTYHSASAYPWQCERGLPSQGIVLGHNELAEGAMFSYDPWELYEAGQISSPNMLVLGRIGSGKSALVKSYMFRQATFGRSLLIVDVKGEYANLANRLSIPVVHLRPGGEWRLNPLDFLDAATSSAQEVFTRRASMIATLVGATMKRDLTPGEHATLEAALATCGSKATLRDVANAVWDPTPEMAAQRRASAQEVAVEGRDIASVLQRLLDGSLGGMFDGETNIDLARVSHGLVIDISSVHGTEAFLPVMVCTAAWLSSLATRRDGSKKILALDESWAAVGSTHMTRFVQSTAKLARQYGIQLILVLHRIADLTAQADDGSETVKQAIGYLSDTETQVIFKQGDADLSVTKETLGLSGGAIAEIRNLTRGRALWRVKNQVALVRHMLTPLLAEICDTDDAMRTGGQR